MKTIIRNRRPTFANGYAQSPGESAYPALWDEMRLFLAPCVGFTGQNNLVSYSTREHLVATPQAVGQVVWGPMPANEGFGIQFLGSTNSRASVANNAEINITGALSIAARVYIVTAAGIQMNIVDRSDRSNLNNGYNMYVNVDDFAFTVNNASNALSVTNILSTGVWYTLVGTFSPTDADAGIRMYVNGVQVGSNATTTAPGSNSDALGVMGSMEFDNVDERLPGYLAWVGIWGRRLSAAEAKRLHDVPCAPLQLRRRVFGRAAGGVDRTMVANLATTADMAAVLQADRPLVAALTGTADLTALLKPDRGLVVPLNATADLSAALKPDRNMRANWVATADLAAVVNADRRVVANLDALATLAAHAAVDRPLVVNFVATSDWAAVLSTGGVKEFAASLQATADLVAKLSADRPLVAGLSATGDLVVVVRNDRPLVAALSATADLAAALKPDRNAAANLSATADISAFAKVDRPLLAALSATADLLAEITTDGAKNFAAALSATADLVAKLSPDRKLVAPFDVTGTLAALLQVDRNMVAALVASGDMNAVARYERNMAAALSATADLQALAKVDRKLVAALVAEAVLLATLSTNAIFRSGIRRVWEVPAREKTWRPPQSGRTWDLQ